MLILPVILFALLIYLASIAKKTISYFSVTSPIEIGKKAASILASAIYNEVSKDIYDKVTKKLGELIDENLKNIRKLEEDADANIIESLKTIFDAENTDNLTEHITSKIHDRLSSHFDLKSKLGNFSDLYNSFVKPKELVKIIAYLILHIASFILYFHHKKKSLYYYTTYHKYIKNYTTYSIKEMRDDDSDLEAEFDLERMTEKEKEDFNQKMNKEKQTYLFKMAVCDIMEKFIKNTPALIFNEKTFIKYGAIKLANGIYSLTYDKNNLIRLAFRVSKKFFHQQVIFYMTNKFPSIIPFFGFNDKCKYQYIYLENKGERTLKQFFIDQKKNNLSNIMSLTNKMIIAYGIACALNFLHDHSIVHRYLKTKNIYLDSNFYPYLSNFYRAVHLKTHIHYILDNKPLKYAPPEFLRDNRIQYDKSFDVYSYGLFLYNLITEETPFKSFNDDNEKLINLIKDKNYRPEFREKSSKKYSNWIKLIQKCWSNEPSARSSFTNIIKELESFVTNGNTDDDIDNEMFMKYKNMITTFNENENENVKLDVL